MLRRVVLAGAILLACCAAGSVVWALSQGEQDPNDIYALTKDGKIYRVPGGAGVPQYVTTIGSPGTFEGEWLDFDPGPCQFVVGPGSVGIYKRLSRVLDSPSDIPGSDVVGGQGGAIDRFRPTTWGKSDILIANPRDPMSGIPSDVLRIRGDNNISTAAVVGSVVIDIAHPDRHYTVPEDVEVNYANGDIYVGVQATADLPSAILRFDKLGGYLGKFDVHVGDPFCMVFDNFDAIPGYELVAASFNGTRQIEEIDVDGALTNRLLAPPSMTADCDDLAINRAGQIVYPAFSDGAIYGVNPTTGAVTTLASGIPQVVSVAFLSRNCFPGRDTQAALGSFTRTTGPTGKPAVGVCVTDPEFSSGLSYIDVSGYNLTIKGMPLPCRIPLDCRRELTSYCFCAEKIDPYQGASIQVSAVDCAGIPGDPPVAMMLSTKGNPSPTVLDLTGLPAGNTRSIVVDNAGIDKMTLDVGSAQYKINADNKSPSGAVLNLVGNKGVVKIALNGLTTLIVPNGPSLKITVQGTGNSTGQDANVEVF